MTNSNNNRKNELKLYPEFLSESHKELFYSVVSQLSNSQQKSPEYLSVAFIITSDSELYEKMRPYFDTNGFSSFKMFEEVDFSSGYRNIAVAAANLFGQDYETSLSEIINVLGHDLFHTLLQALIIRKYGVIG